MKHWGSRPKIYDNDTRIIATWGQSRFFRKGGTAPGAGDLARSFSNYVELMFIFQMSRSGRN